MNTYPKSLNDHTFRVALVVADCDAPWYKKINKLAKLSGESITSIIKNSIEFADKTVFILIIIDDDENIIVGISTFFFSDNSDEKEYYLNIGNIATNENYREKGVFKFMLEIMKRILSLQLKGLSYISGTICLNVAHMNEIARNVYEKCGFCIFNCKTKYITMYLPITINRYDDIHDNLLLEDIMINSLQFLQLLPSFKIYDKYTTNAVSEFCKNICRFGKSPMTQKFWQHYDSYNAEAWQTYPTIGTYHNVLSKL